MLATKIKTHVMNSNGSRINKFKVGCEHVGKLYLNGNQPKNAVGDKAPPRKATSIVIPVSKKGIEKSMSFSRSELIFRAVTHKSAFCETNSATKPFHFLFYKRLLLYQI